MIELHVSLYRSRARDLVSARARVYTAYTRVRVCIRRSERGGGGRVYEIKTLRSNLDPEEGGVYSRGAYNRASTVIHYQCQEEHYYRMYFSLI